MANISDLAKSKGIEIRLYNIIYNNKDIKTILEDIREQIQNIE